MFTMNVLQNVILFGFLIIFEIRPSFALVYTGHSGIGFFIAIAVPLNIPHHNAFVSYNFASSYGIPTDSKIFFSDKYEGYAMKEDANKKHPKIEKLHEDSLLASESARSSSQNNESISEGKPRPLITKQAFYQMIQDKLKLSGLKGEACLLKLICEINSSMVGRYNGVLGTILHILISPSSSASEDLPEKYYKAESNGVIGDCLRYEKNCPYSLLDIFSVPIEGLLDRYLSKIVNKNY